MSRVDRLKRSTEVRWSEDELDNLPSEVIAKMLIRGDDCWSEAARALLAGQIEHERQATCKRRREGRS